MKQIIAGLILILAFSFVSFAQKEIRIVDPHPFDSFGKLSLNDRKGRFDNFFAALSNNGDAKGVVIFELDKNESKAKKRKRLEEISKRFNFRKIDKFRFTFIVYEGDEEFTTFRLIPKTKNWDDLLYEDRDYKLIKGEELQQKINELFPK